MLRYIPLYLSWFVFYIEWKSVRLELLTSIYFKKNRCLHLTTLLPLHLIGSCHTLAHYIFAPRC